MAYCCHNLLELSKSSQEFKFGQTGGSWCKMVSNVYPRHKARHKGNQVGDPPSPEATDGQETGQMGSVPVSSMHKVAKSDKPPHQLVGVGWCGGKMALSCSKLGQRARSSVDSTRTILAIFRSTGLIPSPPRLICAASLIEGLC